MASIAKLVGLLLFASVHPSEVYTTTVKVLPVRPKSDQVTLRVPFRNLRDTPVHVKIFRASCSCAKPRLVGGNLIGVDGEGLLQVSISVPAQEKDIKGNVMVYGVAVGEPRREDSDEETEIEDMIAIANLQFNVPVLEEVAIDTGNFRGVLEFGEGDVPQFIFKNRSIHRGSISIDCDIPGISVTTEQVDSSEREDVFMCTTRGFDTIVERGAPELRLTTYVDVGDASMLLSRHTLKTKFLTGYSMHPGVLRKSRDELSFIINCRSADPNEVLKSLTFKDRKGSELDAQLWSGRVTSKRWIKIELSASDLAFDEISSLDAYFGTKMIGSVFLRGE